MRKHIGSKIIDMLDELGSVPEHAFVTRGQHICDHIDRLLPLTEYSESCLTSLLMDEEMFSNEDLLRFYDQCVADKLLKVIIGRRI